MAKFSATDAAFAGFSIMARRPLALLGWALLYGAFFAASGAGMVLLIGAEMASLQRVSGSATADPTAIFRALAAIAPVALVSLGASLLFYATLNASAYRTILRPDEGAPFNIGFGAAELRQAALMVVMALVLFGCLIASAIAAGVIAALLALLGAAASGASPAARGIVGGLSVVVFLAGYVGGIVILAIKFSLAGPATFARRKIMIFESWELTKGSFWSLLGAYLLAGALTLVVALLGYGIMIGATLGASGFNLQGLERLGRVDTVSISAYFSATRVIVMFFSSLLTVFIVAMSNGPAAFAYRAIASESPVDAF